MDKKITFEGRIISVPGDFTEEEIASVLDSAPQKQIKTPQQFSAEATDDKRAQTLGGAVSSGGKNMASDVYNVLTSIPSAVTRITEAPAAIEKALFATKQGVKNIIEDPSKYINSAASAVENYAKESGNYLGNVLAADFAKQHPNVFSLVTNNAPAPKSSLTQDIYGKISEHPWQSAMAIAPSAMPWLKAGTAIAGEIPAVKTAAQKTAELLIPYRQGKKIVTSVGTTALTTKEKTAQQVLADAIAEHKRLMEELSLATNAPSAPTSIGIGEAKDVSDIAGTAQRNIFATQQAEKEAMQAAREHLQGLEQEAVTLNEAAGKPFVETSGVQEILKKAAPFKNFDPATAPTILPTSDKQTRSLYRLVHDALANKEFSYTDPITGEEITRTFNNSFSAASDLRRFLGQAFNKETGGYGAIKKSIQTDLYDLLSKAENEYTAGASQAWKDNYSASKKLAERFEENPRVARVVKTYGTEGKPVMTPAQFADVLTSGDRTQINDLFEATADKLKPQLRQSIADAIETKFRGANYDTFAKEMAPGGKLSDQLKHEELASFRPQIENYMIRLKDAENAGVTAERLSLKVPTTKRTVETAGIKAREVETNIKEFNDLSKLSPDQALDAAYKHITDVRESGQMTKAEYDIAYDQLSKAKKLLGITPTMRTKVISILKKTGKGVAKVAIPASVIGGSYYLGHSNNTRSQTQ